ncbi:MAG: peptidoglycan DD-metalloendopeptidase family protein [Planctomycetaceae bacterium]|nr:peptidoglycan DD-metalloendopeptidase family protein [Planctomycetaceae bacterium]
MRLPLAANLTVLEAYIRDTTSSTSKVTSPVLGQQLFVTTRFTATDLPAGSYSYRASVDGVALSTSISFGASGANGTYTATLSGWYDNGQAHSIVVELDATSLIAETSELDNSTSFSITAGVPTTLPQKFTWPLSGQEGVDWAINNYIDMDPSTGFKDYRGKNRTYDGHDAIDVGPSNNSAMDVGIPIMAAASGVVIAVHDGEFDRNVALNSLTANYVYVRHNADWVTKYLHLRRDSIQVEVGDAVTTGQVLGMMGSSGNSTGVHLHFDVEFRGLSVETMISPTDYWINPPTYTIDVPIKLIQFGVTSSPPTDSDFDELPNVVEEFKQQAGLAAVAWGQYSGMAGGSLLEWRWIQPDGNEYSRSTLTTPIDYGHSQWWSRKFLPATPALGNWRLQWYVNSTFLGERTFAVTASGTPEIHVTQGTSTVVTGRTTPFDFGSLTPGASPLQHTFTVTNQGTSPLLVSNLTVPLGFSIVEGLSSSITPGLSDTFTVQMDTSLLGYRRGVIHILSNDTSEGDFVFDVEGQVNQLLDSGFATAGRGLFSLSPDTDNYRDVDVLTNGRVIAVGTSSDDLIVSRFLANGQLDPTFGTNGHTITDFGNLEVGYSLAVQNDGKILVAGQSGTQALLARYTENGVLDTSFGNSGRVLASFGGLSSFIRDIELLPDGRILVGGNTFSGGFYNSAVARFSAFGLLDTTFGVNGVTISAIGTGDDEIMNVELQSSGRIVVIGYSGSATGTADFMVSRYLANGQIDTTFGTNGSTLLDFAESTNRAWEGMVTADDRILAVGHVGNSAAIARFNSSGQLDTTFNGRGWLVDDRWQLAFNECLLIATDGTIYVGGGAYVPFSYDFYVAAYNPDGSVRKDFGFQGVATTDFAASTDRVLAIRQNATGQIVVVGEAMNSTSWLDIAIARIQTPQSQFAVTLSASGPSLIENGTLVVTASLPNLSIKPVELQVTFSGNAILGVDYSASTTTITIEPGQSSGLLTLMGLDDIVFESSESVNVDVREMFDGSELAFQSLTVPLTDNDPPSVVSLSLSDSTLFENNGTVLVNASIPSATTQDITVILGFSGTATLNVDYSASSNTLIIPSGQVSSSILLNARNDATFDDNESIVIDISSVEGGVANSGQQTVVTLTDDDSPPSAEFALVSNMISESAGNVMIAVTLSSPSAVATTVPFTFGGTATGGDRTVSASPLVIAAGQTSTAIVVNVINDPLDEMNESVVLQLGAPTGGTLGANTAHTLMIVDNDAPPVVQFTALAQNLGEATPTAAAVVRLTQPSGLDVIVPITISGSATNADVSISTTLPVVIPAGQISAAINVAITDDTAVEVIETVVLTIGTPTNATRGAVSAHSVSIFDDDSTVTVQFAGGNFPAREAVGAVPLTVTLSTFALQPITVPLILSGSADGHDYRLSTTTVTIPAGQTRAIFTLTVTDDQLDELPETLTIQLGTPTGGELGTNTALTVTIDDNDPVLSFARTTDTTSDENGTITVIARSLSPVIADLTVPFTSYGRATLGVDYTLSANAFQFVAGSSTAAVTLTILDDAVVESSEAVTLSLQPPPNTSLGSPGLYTLFISDNDTPPAVGLDLNGLATGQDFLSPVGEFVEDAAALVIVPNATVVPPGVQTLNSITVYLESAPNGSAESLSAVNFGGATATAYNPTTRSLSISGGSTSEQQAVLRSVAYQNSSQNPTAGGRFITVTANFSASSESRRRKLTVTPVDDAPVVTTTAGSVPYVTGNVPVLVDRDIALTDIENNRLVRADVTITDAESGDLLSLSSPVAGFRSTFAGNVLTITANAGSGNLAAFRSALSRVQFSTTTLGDGNRSVSFVVTDTSGLAGVAGATSSAAARTITVQSPLLVAASPLNSAAASESLTADQLSPLVHEAITRWESAGATVAQLNALRAATIEIRDLSDPRTLALAGGATIVLDTNAAGRGWFVDSTPTTDEEFTIPLSTSAARASPGPVVERVDLLTTVMHEFGHLLGLDDHASDDLLGESLPLGTRRTLTAAELNTYFEQFGS